MSGLQLVLLTLTYSLLQYLSIHGHSRKLRIPGMVVKMHIKLVVTTKSVTDLDCCICHSVDLFWNGRLTAHLPLLSHLWRVGMSMLTEPAGQQCTSMIDQRLIIALFHADKRVRARHPPLQTYIHARLSIFSLHIKRSSFSITSLHPTRSTIPGFENGLSLRL